MGLPVELAMQPDLVLYNAGVDVHRDDDLGRFLLSDTGLALRDNFDRRMLPAPRHPCRFRDGRRVHKEEPPGSVSPACRRLPRYFECLVRKTRVVDARKER